MSLILMTTTISLSVLTTETIVDTFLRVSFSSGFALSSELIGIRKISGGVPVFLGGSGVGCPMT